MVIRMIRKQHDDCIALPMVWRARSLSAKKTRLAGEWVAAYRDKQKGEREVTYTYRGNTLTKYCQIMLVDGQNHCVVCREVYLY
jgi:hypothetical protein